MGFWVSAVCRSITNRFPSLGLRLQLSKGESRPPCMVMGDRPRFLVPGRGCTWEFSSAALTADGDKRALSHTLSIPSPTPSVPPCPSPSGMTVHLPLPMLSSLLAPLQKPDPLASRLLCSCFPALLSSSSPSAVLCLANLAGQSLSLPPLLRPAPTS